MSPDAGCAPSQENQRLVSRVCQVQRLVRQARRQCRLVAARLDQHGDDYRQAARARDETGAPGRTAAATPQPVSGRGGGGRETAAGGGRLCLIALMSALMTRDTDVP